MIATVTLNPALDKTVYVRKVRARDTNRILKIEQDAGGKGVNASRVLKELGSETVALGFIGGATGSFIEHVLQRDGIPTDFVHIAGVTRTNIAIQEEDGSPPTMLNEPGPEIRESELDALTAKVESAAARSYAVFFGGSVTCGAPPNIYSTLISRVKAKGSLAILDADGAPLVEGLAAVPYMIKPNIDEAARLFGARPQSEAEVAREARSICERGVHLVVISMGKKGAIATTLEESWFAKAPEVLVVSTIGSGDSMVAGILHALAQGGGVEEALRLGTAAGAATAMTTGAEIGRRADILRLVDQVVVKQLRP